MKNLLLILALFIVGCASTEDIALKMNTQLQTIENEYAQLSGFKALVRVAYPKSFKFFISSGKQTQSEANIEAINKCIKETSGDWVCLLWKENKEDVIAERWQEYLNAKKLPGYANSFLILNEQISDIQYQKVFKKNIGQDLSNRQFYKVYRAGSIWGYERLTFEIDEKIQLISFNNNIAKFKITSEDKNGKSTSYEKVYLKPEQKNYLAHDSLRMEILSIEDSEITYKLSKISTRETSYLKNLNIVKLRDEENKRKAERYTQRLTDRCEAMGFVERVNILNCIQKERQHEELMARQKSLIAAEKQRLTLNQPPPEQGFWAQMGEALLEGMEEGFALGMEQRIYESAGINNSYSGGYYSSNPSSINQVNCLEQKINRLERRTGTRVCKDGNCYYEAPKYDFSGIFGQDACIKYK